jgi:hypothetical protein
MLVRAAHGGRSHRVIDRWRGSAACLVVALLAVAFPAVGCGRRSDAGSNLNVTWTLSPPAPMVGPASLTVTLRDPAGTPVNGAAVRLEGHMSHAGMTPVIVLGAERSPGVYDLAFAFTMPGDWVLLVTATRPDGTRLERRIDVTNVRPAGEAQGRP